MSLGYSPPHKIPWAIICFLGLIGLCQAINLQHSTYKAITDTSASLAGNQPFLRLLNFLCDYTGLSLTQIKEAPLFGNTYKYAMYEAQYDEELYMMKQQPCPCFNATLPCYADESKRAPVVDENVMSPEGGYIRLDELKEGVWYNNSIMNHYGMQYMKFELAYNPAKPCPILVFEFQQQVGTLSAYISARYIPNNVYFDFHHPFYGPSHTVICASQPQFYYGTYYVLLANQAGRSTNIYALRFSTYQSPTCSPPPPINVHSLPSTPGSTWLEDGVIQPVHANQSSYSYYQLYSPGRCSNFSASVFKTSYTDLGPSIFVSVNRNMRPNEADLSQVDWLAYRYIDVFVSGHYCNPDPHATHNIFYIGLNMGLDAVGSFQFIATTQLYMPSTPLSSIAYYQYRLDMAFGASPRLVCEDAIFPCTFFSYKGCTFGCCQFFGPATPEEHIQAIWPWNSADNSVAGFHLGINWSDMQPLVPGRLAWSLILEWSDAVKRNLITTVDPGKCNITLTASFHNAKFEPLPATNISFTRKEEVCDYQEYLKITSKMDSLISSYIQANENVNDLALQQVRVAIASWNDVYDACQNLITDRYLSLLPEYADDYAYICTKFPRSVEWFLDPCCNSQLISNTSCRSTAVSRLLPMSGTVNRDATALQCANPECSASSAQTFMATMHNAEDPTTGCQASISQAASVDMANSLLVFTIQCQRMIESEDLLGARCTSSSQCYKNASCNPSTGRCLHTPDDVLDCMANRIKFDTALGLFSLWGLSGKPDNVSLIQAFRERWVRPLCTGPHANSYRSGFRYVGTLITCSDLCVLQDAEPYCVDSSKSRTAVCPIPTYCDRIYTPSACHRYWNPIFEDEQACLSSKICNWQKNLTYPCPQGSVEDCEPACLSGTPNVCLDCSRDLAGTCLEIDWITTESRCNLGLCTTNASVTGSSECALSGICSANCNNCTESQCTSTGTCGDYNDFKSLVDAGKTGVCLRKRSWNGFSYSCPSGWSLKPWTCASKNSSVLEADCPTLAVDAVWYNFSNTASNCISNAGYGCFSRSANTWWDRNKTECSICPDCVWKSHYSWSYGVWTPGRIQALVWDTRRYFRATSYQPSVDYTQVTRDVNAAITRDFASAYYTDALCRYDSINNLVKSIVCDCDTPEKSNCFVDRDQAAIGSTLVCPYQARNLSTSVATASVSDDAVAPFLSCQTIGIAAASVGKYQVPPDHSVTHALFNKIEKNPYLIVVNSHGSVVGQLASDAASISFDFIPNVPINFCVFIESFIQIDSAATIYTLAEIQSDHSIEVLNGASVWDYGLLESFARSQNSSRLRVCSEITKPGTYFAVAVVPNFKKLNPRPNAESIAAACIYSALLVFSVVQAILLIMDRSRQKLLKFKLVAILVVCTNAAVRMVYILPPKNAFKKGSESIAFIVFELPTFLCFSIFTVIMYLWIIVVIHTRHFDDKKRMSGKKPMVRLAFLLMNIFMYFVFVVFIFLIAILPQATKKSPCFLGSLDSAVTTIERNIKIAYWIFQLVISVLLAIGFLAAALSLLRVILSLRTRDIGRQARFINKGSERAAAADVQMIIITVVAFVCVAFLLVRSSIFLHAAVTSSTLHVIVFCILEVVPQSMLIFYLHPFRCFREAGRRSSGSSNKSRSATTVTSIGTIQSTVTEELSDMQGYSDDSDDSTSSDEYSRRQYLARVPDQDSSSSLHLSSEM